MALPATHIRFALDLAHRFPIARMDRYLSGTLYPDSRWLTGVDRQKSHDARYLDSDFPDAEYTYGIHVHCLCDQVQSQVFEEGLPGLKGLQEPARWIYVSAAKMVQDSFDMQCFDLQKYLPLLVHAENMHREDPDRVLAFNRIVQNAYANKKTMAPADYRRLWVRVGLLPETASEMAAEMKNMLERDEPTELIRRAYDEMRQRIS